MSQQAFIVRYYFNTKRVRKQRFPENTTLFNIGNSPHCEFALLDKEKRTIDKNVCEKHIQVQPKENGVYRIKVFSPQGITINGTLVPHLRSVEVSNETIISLTKSSQVFFTADVKAQPKTLLLDQAITNSTSKQPELPESPPVLAEQTVEFGEVMSKQVQMMIKLMEEEENMANHPAQPNIIFSEKTTQNLFNRDTQKRIVQTQRMDQVQQSRRPTQKMQSIQTPKNRGQSALESDILGSKETRKRVAEPSNKSFVSTTVSQPNAEAKNSRLMQNKEKPNLNKEPQPRETKKIQISKELTDLYTQLEDSLPPEKKKSTRKDKSFLSQNAGNLALENRRRMLRLGSSVILVLSISIVSFVFVLFSSAKKTPAKLQEYNYAIPLEPGGDAPKVKYQNPIEQLCSRLYRISPKQSEINELLRFLQEQQDLKNHGEYWNFLGRLYLYKLYLDKDRIFTVSRAKKIYQAAIEAFEKSNKLYQKQDMQQFHLKLQSWMPETKTHTTEKNLILESSQEISKDAKSLIDILNNLVKLYEKG